MNSFTTKKLSTMLFLLSALFMLASCEKSEEEKKTNYPKIIQSEQILDNPITLAFSWEAMDNATEYIYQLEAVKSSGNQVIANGKTPNLNIEIASTPEAELMYLTEYIFTLKAVFSDASQTSEAAVVRVTTNSGAIAMYVENLTYRSALMKSEPKDNDMYYQFAQVPLEKFESYGTDMNFIETYDYGYYKTLGKQYNIPWYNLMQEFSHKGKHQYETRMLKPERSYIFYTYGVEFTQDPENPVKVITPMIKHIFTTPKWEATSQTTFQVEVESQELVNIGNDEYIAKMNVKVTPSDAQERYYVAFAEKAQLQNQYKNDVYDYAFDIIYSEELYNSVDDWSTSNMLSSGEKVVNSMDLGWGLYPGAEYQILVFGVDGKGLVTTPIMSFDCTAIGMQASTAMPRDGESFKGHTTGTKAAAKTADRI